MKRIATFLSLTFVLMLAAAGLRAQSLPPLQPEQDACGALPICGGTFYTPYSYTGYGYLKELYQSTAVAGYGSGQFDESNSVWLKLTVATAGTIDFSITPVVSNNDYDFAVFNITGKTCDSVTIGNRVRCNGYYNQPPYSVTGLSSTGTGTTSGPGPGVPFLSEINAAVGETYLILIDNFSTTGVGGFTIDFTASSATFVGGVAPHFDTVKKVCDYSTGIDVHLTKPVKCSSLQSNGSDFRLVPANGTVSAATGVNCATNGYTQDVILTFSNALPAGTYSLKAKLGTDGNTLLDLCNTPMPVDDSIQFIVAAPLTVSAGTDTVTCIHNSIQLNATITGGATAGNSIVWTPAATLSNPNIANPVATPSVNTTYTVKVTPNGFGASCSKSASVKVDVLQGFTLTNKDTTVCKGANVQLNAVGDNRYKYTWTPFTYLSNPNIRNPSATPDTTITYTVVASHAGCTDSARSVKITVEPVPSVYIGPDLTKCYGDTLMMHPVVTPTWFGNYSYSWTPAASFNFPNTINPIFTALDTTTILLTVTTPAGCTGKDDRIINVIPNDFATVSADTGICPGDTVRLHASGGRSYLWVPSYGLSSDTSANPYASPITTIPYTLYALNAIGCRDTQSVKVTVYPRAIISLPDSVKLYPGESYQVDPGGNCLYFSWFPPLGLSNPNIANPLAKPDVNTKYFIQARTETGCMASDTMVVMVDYESVIDVPNAFTPGSSGPNHVLAPVHRGDVTLNYFRIYDRWGKLVFESADIDKGWDGMLNGTPQPMGVYVYLVKATLPGGKVFTKQGNITLLR